LSLPSRPIASATILVSTRSKREMSSSWIMRKASSPSYSQRTKKEAHASDSEPPP
jgi:hypothetical protein